MFVNGEQVGTLSNFHIINAKLSTPTVTALAYSVDSSKLQILKMSWNFGDYFD
jgi:hypothetical protein